MAISRPFLLALIGIALLGATVFAVQNSRDSATNEAAPVAAEGQAQPAQSSSQPAAKLSPQQSLEAALTSDELRSASFDAELSFTAAGEKNVVSADGAFELGGPSDMPKVDFQLSVDAQGMDVNGGFVTTGDNAWFTRGDSAYAVPDETWSKIVDAVEKGAGGQRSSAPGLGLDPARWLRDVKAEDGGEVDGVETTHVSGQVNSAGAAAQIAKAMDRTGQLPAALPPGLERRAERVLDDASFDVWVGEDRILRRATLELSGKGDGNQRVDMNFRVELSGVNEPQAVDAPANATDRLPTGAYGQFANGFLVGLGTSVGVEPSALGAGVPVTNAHIKAERAVAQGRRVVIFFENPRGLDDRAVATSVRELDRNTKNVVVLTDHVGNVDRYGSLVEDLGVNQAPSIVVVDRGGQARLLEGYVDAETLAQVVADAR